jgi:multiple sugar transport system permease protein
LTPLERPAAGALSRRAPARSRLRFPNKKERRNWAAAYALLAPALALLGFWFVYPIVQTFILSFQKVNLFQFSNRDYVGLHNFQQLWHDPAFHHSLYITLIFVVFVVPAQTLLALALATVLSSVGVGKTLFRTAYFLPYMTSTVAVTTVFMKLFVFGGPLSTFGARALGLTNTTWYADVNYALPFLVVVYVYMYIGLYIVVFVSGIEGIPPELYEAAKVDGARTLQKFRFVTVPSLRPYVVFVVVAGLIQAVQIFDQAYVISSTGAILGSPAGATATLVIFIYQEAFRLNALGYASAGAVVLLLVVFVGTAVTRRLLPERG